MAQVIDIAGDEQSIVRVVRSARNTADSTTRSWNPRWWDLRREARTWEDFVLR